MKLLAKMDTDSFFTLQFTELKCYCLKISEIKTEKVYKMFYSMVSNQENFAIHFKEASLEKLASALKNATTVQAN